jgi:hypothetical protein
VPKVRHISLLVAVSMATSQGYPDRLRNFYDIHLRSLDFGSAVADVILVPLLALNLLGVITIEGPYAREIVAIFAFIDVSSTAILLVAGYLGPDRPRVACANCRGEMRATVSYWTCEKCGAKLTPPGGTSGG